MVSLSSSPPISGLEHIYSSDLYPLNGVCPNSESPFPLLPGEYLTYMRSLDSPSNVTNGSTDVYVDDSSGMTSSAMAAVITNYRFFLRTPNIFINITLASIESVECKEIFYVQINCKNAQAYRCCFNTNDQCVDLVSQLSAYIVNQSLERLEHVFAFGHYAWISHHNPNFTLQYQYNQAMVLSEEVRRMGFDLDKAWRISTCNEEYKICDTYPKYNVVPNWITDAQIESSSKFRACNRFPVVVWRCQDTGSVIARCSQPEVGLLGWRNSADEKLLHSFAVACQMNLPEKIGAARGDGGDVVNTAIPKRLLIIDARSYTAAVANRAKGGGCECSEYYSNCEIQYMGLANIHSIRKSFNALRTLCLAPDQSSWLSSLEQSKWLSHISNLIRSALVICRAVQESRSVIVHCSDGWDRTPQIITISELLTDPYYRTTEGFIILMEREWLDYGHKFADRCGTGVRTDDLNERCPVFTQWLDCVHQLIKQFPTCFQFNESFLIKLVHHAYSCLYGTFLCNSTKQRGLSRVDDHTVSVWSLLLDNQRYVNLLYQPSNKIIYPCFNVRSLHIWSAIWFNEQSSPLNTFTSPPASGASSSSLTADRKYTKKNTTSTVASSGSSSSSKSRSCEDICTEMFARDQRDGIATTPVVASYSKLGDGDSCQFLTNGRRLSDTMISPAPVLQQQQHLDELRMEPSPFITTTDITTTTNITVAMEQLDVVGADNGEDSVSTSLSDDLGIVTGRGNACELRAVLTNDDSSSTAVTQPMNIPTLRLLDPLSCHGSTDTLTSSPLTSPDTLASIASKRLIGGEGTTAAAITKCSIATSTGDISDSMIIPDATILNQLSTLIVTNHETASSDTSSSINDKYTPSLSIHSNSNPSDKTDAFWGDDDIDHNAIVDCSLLYDSDGLVTWQSHADKSLLQNERKNNAEKTLLKRQLCYFKNILKQYGENLKNVSETVIIPINDEPTIEKNNSPINSENSWEQVEEKEADIRLWVPDHAVTHCNECHLKFWIVRRKHHCRNCGNVFCAECTNYTPVPNQFLTTPVRVCKRCFNTTLTTDSGLATPDCSE